MQQKDPSAIETHLLTPLGLRSLAPSDPAYRPRYEGDVASRDSAYHQGTVWPWLMGPFITAFMKVHGDSAEARDAVGHWLGSLVEHLETAGLGQISELADGNLPHRPGGSVAQAWSVGELLRAIVEDVQRVPKRELRANPATLPVTPPRRESRSCGL